MPDFGAPAVSQRLLGSELRRLRKHARLTGKGVATQLGWSEAKLSRIEQGQSMIKMTDLGQLMSLYQVAASQQADLIALAEKSREPSPVEAVLDELPPEHARYLEAEAAAQTMWDWEPQFVPGLLQVEDYTHALLQEWPEMFARPIGEVDRRVESSRVRKAVLTRDPPLELSVVIDESVLYRRVGTRSVMHSQLAHLARMAERSYIDLRVLPLAGNQVIATGGFVYFTFAPVRDIALPDLVALEHLNGTLFVDDESALNAYHRVFKALQHYALDPKATRAMLTRVSQEARALRRERVRVARYAN